MKKLQILILTMALTVALSNCGGRNPGTGQLQTDPNGLGMTQPAIPNTPTYQPPLSGGYTDPYAGGGYGNPYGNGQTMGYDPVTGQPLAPGMYGQNGMMNPNGINPALDPGISTQIVSKIQQAGGYKGFKADDAVRDSMKSLGMSVADAFRNAPLDHRSLIVKTLLDGWASKDDSSYAQQVWSTVPSTEQQRLIGQDAYLSKLIQKKLKG